MFWRYWIFPLTLKQSILLPYHGRNLLKYSIKKHVYHVEFSFKSWEIPLWHRKFLQKYSSPHRSFLFFVLKMIEGFVYGVEFSIRSWKIPMKVSIISGWLRALWWFCMRLLAIRKHVYHMGIVPSSPILSHSLQVLIPISRPASLVRLSRCSTLYSRSAIFLVLPDKRHLIQRLMIAIGSVVVFFVVIAVGCCLGG